MPTPDIAIYVSANCFPPSEDDQLLADAIGSLGLEAEVRIWDRPDDDPARVSIVRSTWDYVPRIEQFSAWLQETAKSSRLMNPLEAQRLCLDKRYLLGMREAGVPVPPTELVETPDRIASVAEARGWTDVVVKGLLSSGGRQIIRHQTRETHAPHFDGPFLVQPYLQGIQQGEYSCIGVAGEVSHCVVKHAAPGEFRVQDHYGGTVEAVPPPDDVVAVSLEALASLGVEHDYGRIDIVVHEGAAMVMEVELVEPDLFLRCDHAAADRLAAAAARHL